MIGKKPGSSLSGVLKSHLRKFGYSADQIIVHHYTDRDDGRLQLEVEFRYFRCSIVKFQRIIL